MVGIAMASSRVTRLGASVLLSLVMTASLAAAVFGASPTDPPPSPTASPTLTAVPAITTNPGPNAVPTATATATATVTPGMTPPSHILPPAPSADPSTATRPRLTPPPTPTARPGQTAPSSGSPSATPVGQPAARSATAAKAAACETAIPGLTLPRPDCTGRVNPTAQIQPSTASPAATTTGPGGSHSVKGTVTGPGAAPQAGISVRVGPLSCWCYNYLATTASDGTYTVTGVSSGTYGVWFWDATGAYLNGYYTTGGLTTDRTAATPVSVGASDVTGINVQLSIGQYLSGTVTGTGGAAAANITVYAYSSTYDGCAKTAANGSYAIDVPTGSYTVRLYDTSGNYLNGYYGAGGFKLAQADATIVTVSGGGASGINVQLQTGHYIRGTVTGPGGTQLAGISVNAYSNTAAYQGMATTGANGSYSIDAVPGSYTLWFDDPNGTYFGGYYGGGGVAVDYTSQASVTMASADVSGINAQLQAGHYIRGTVTGTGGTPLAGINISANSATFGNSTTTASDGTYGVFVPAGTYTLNFYDYSGTYFNGYYSSGGSGHFSIVQGSATPVTVGTADVTGFNVQLGTGHHISGTVTGTGGTLVANIDVWVYSSGYSYYSGDVTTASDGTYSIAVPAGAYTVRFNDYTGTYFGGYYTSGGLTPNSYDATPVTVGTSDVPSINAQLKTGYHIKGTVTGTGGTPLGNVSVSAETSSYYYGSTAADGTYEVYVPAGTYTLYFRDQSGSYLNGYYSIGGTGHFSALQGSATPVTVGSADVTGFNVQLGTGHHISGTVTGTGGGPLAGIYVDAYSPDYYADATTAADGSYSVMVPAGTYNVEFSDYNNDVYLHGYYASGGFTVDQNSATPVTVGTSDVTGINVRLQAGRHISGTVTGPGGMPVSAIFVEVWSSTFDIWMYTGLDGTYSLMVPAGTYTVHFADWSDAYLSGYYSSSGFQVLQYLATPVTVGTSDVTGINVQLQTGHTISGTVTGTGDGPLGNISVRTFCIAGDQGPSTYCDSTTTASDGTYSLRVTAGSYKLEFDDNNGTYVTGYYSSNGFTTDLGAATPVTVGASDVAGINVKMETGVHIKGTVTGPGGTPVQSIYVYTNSLLGDYYDAYTASDGTYSLLVPAGTYAVAFYDLAGRYLKCYHTSSGYTVDQASATPVTVGTSDVTGINVQLGTGYNIKGIVTGPTGALLAGIYVNVWSNSDHGGQATTASDGTYSIDVPTDTYRVQFWGNSNPQGYYKSGGFTLDSASATPVTVGTSDVTGINVQMFGPLDHLVLSPVGATIAAGSSQPYTAEGFDAYGHDVGDYTYGATITIDSGAACPSHSCTATLAGDHTVTGTDGSFHGTATLHVTAAAIHHLVVSPSSATVAPGETQSYTAAAADVYGNIIGDVTSATTFAIGGGSCSGASCASTAIGDHTVTGTDSSATGTATLHVSGTTGATYHALTPTRILDSRDGTGGVWTPFTSHSARTFQVTGRGGVPANATAVTGNLTVTGQTAPGFLYVGPNTANNPGSSTLNFPLADDRANAVTVALGAGGTLSVTYAASTLGPTAQVIFDVTGYFTPDTSGATYHALTPARILDSRDGTGGVWTPFSSHVARTFGVAGHGGVPGNAIAVTGNLTVTQQTALGYLYVGPVAMNNPTSSTLNFPLGDDRANGVTVALGAGGTLAVTYAASTLGPTAQVIFDVTGYFTPDTSGAKYVPLTPARILDSRDGTGGVWTPFSSHVARTFGVTGQGGVPANATAVTGNLTVTQQTTLGYLYMGPVATNNPTSSTLNFPMNDDRANGVTVALGAGGTLSATYAASTLGPTAQVIFDVTGYFVP
jgi:hypothetical protein